MNKEILEKEISKKTIALAVASALCAAILFISIKTINDNAKEAEVRRQAELALKEQPAPEPAVDYFKDITIEAKAAYVYDVNKKKVLFQRNADMALPLASITKVMTALVAEEKISKENRITIDTGSLQEEGESGLIEGERWNLKDILSYMLMVSSNDGARSIANVFSGFASTSSDPTIDDHPSFVNEMNRKAAELGLATMNFSNPTGLDLEGLGDAGAYGSAKDVAKLFEYTIKEHPGLLESTRHSIKTFSSDTMPHQAKNTNITVHDIPNLIASKTGYTAIAGGNLAIAFDKGLNEPVIIVVLGSSQGGRFDDVLRLASSTMETYNGSK